jgi:hypothetical protein
MSVNDVSRIIIDDSRVMLQIVASLTDSFVAFVASSNVFGETYPSGVPRG